MDRGLDFGRDHDAGEDERGPQLAGHRRDIRPALAFQHHRESRRGDPKGIVEIFETSHGSTIEVDHQDRAGRPGGNLDQRRGRPGFRPADRPASEPRT